MSLECRCVCTVNNNYMRRMDFAISLGSHDVRKNYSRFFGVFRNVFLLLTSCLCAPFDDSIYSRVKSQKIRLHSSLQLLYKHPSAQSSGS